MTEVEQQLADARAANAKLLEQQQSDRRVIAQWRERCEDIERAYRESQVRVRELEAAGGQQKLDDLNATIAQTAHQAETSREIAKKQIDRVHEIQTAVQEFWERLHPMVEEL